MRYEKNKINEKRLTEEDFKDAEIIHLWLGKDDITEGKFVEAVMKYERGRKSKNEQEETMKPKNKQVIRIDSNELVLTKKGGEITWP